MAQADSVLSTPPTNTSAINPARPADPTRRGFIAVAAGASIISVGSLAAVAMPIAAAAPAAQALDAELIELGARFEPLVDQYYAARKRWARSLVAATLSTIGNSAIRQTGTMSTRQRSGRHSRIAASVRAPTAQAMRFMRSSRK